MSDLLQIIVSGLSTGSIYALAAVGFTLLWQASQTINFAQGEFVMLPAFFVLTAMGLGALLWPAIAIALVLSLLILGVAFKKVVVEPMLPHGILPLVIATIAWAVDEGKRQGILFRAGPTLSACVPVRGGARLWRRDFHR